MRTYLCIDVGGTAIKYALIKEDGTLFSTSSTPTPKTSFEDLLTVFDNLVHPVYNQVSGIAISFPGRVNNITGHVYTGGAIDHFMNNVPFKQLLEQRYQLPVAIENDGKCAALAELWLGNLKDVHSGAVLCVGYGIGGGIVLDRKLWRGVNDSAGEFCCMLTDYSKEIHHSLFNTSNGIFGLLRPYAERKNVDVKEINGYDFFNALHQQDEDAKQVFESYIHHFLSGIFTLQAILDLEKICIGGGISSEDSFIESLKNTVNEYFDCAPAYIAVNRPVIDRCAFRNSANLIGALKNFLDIHG